jgi:hypothetical protein
LILFQKESTYVLKHKEEGMKFSYICSNFIGLPCNLITGKDVFWEVFAAGSSNNSIHTAQNRYSTERSARHTKKQKRGEPAAGRDDKKVFKILHLTDIHHDSQYQEGSLANCPGYLCCRPHYGVPAEAADRAGKWGDYRNCDTPGILIDFMLDHIKDNHKVRAIILCRCKHGRFPKNKLTHIYSDCTNVSFEH